jgi:pyrimidine-specific ribonucleoside hydrolase
MEGTFAHPWKPAHFVIIETDGGFDDFRAINLMMKSSNIRVLGFVASNGVIDAQTTTFKIKGLMNELHHQGIRIGINATDKVVNYGCKPAINFNWGSSDVKEEPIDYKSLINDILKNTHEKITWVSLASLNSLCSYINEFPDQMQRFSKCIWSVNQLVDSSFNYQIDTNAYLQLKDKICIVRVNQAGKQLVYSPEFIANQLGHNSGDFYASLKLPSVYSSIVGDELVSFYLHDSLYFKSKKVGSNEWNASLLPDFKYEDKILDLMCSDLLVKNQVFAAFPVDSNLYAPELRGKITATIQKFGADEWQSCVITSELHRHVGIYALVGTKMGVRAKEYFAAGVDEMQVVSFAGENPPISCMNDGLQVSAGASLGHGLISLDTTQKAMPVADFTYLGQKIRIKLKDGYRKQIYNQVHQLEMTCGTSSNTYWEYLRVIAFEIWFTWDRDEIFEIVKLN